MEAMLSLLDEKTNYCGWAKPCQIYINQAYREGYVVMGDRADRYVVVYKMPNGRLYVKQLDEELATKILNIDWNTSIENGKVFEALGF